ncbi:uncharacterized protein LOC125434203 isoform X2 [Sphaerodactylus townsendi]|uniref:uncharacterized protein LOC125434203 isoform X2 n=1 Tax=Sphaerodactylus townsendi TaxID=933632 RepID=UPI002026CB5F|nr:uncharacterized protein LOC125434203 isoform X2 [Sphaerodactylus townsendi]
MEAPFSLTVACDCSLMFGAALPPDRRMPPAPSLFFIVVSLVTIRPATAKVSHNTCEEVQAFQGVQDTRALPGKLFFYPISPFAFLGTITHYKVTLTNGSVLPNWLEYNHNTRTLQGLPMPDESGDYHLTVAAHGEACGPNTPAATANFVLHVHNSITVCEKQLDINQKPVNDIIYSEGQCAQDISVTFAEIIILNPAGSLTIQERLSLIYTMAEYLHLDPVFLTLIPFRESFKKHLWNLTIVGEDIKCIGTVENHYVELCWPVGFGLFAMLYELVQVLRHNIQSSHLSQLLGYEIAGWRILQKGNHEKRHAGKRHRRQLMATPRPTMTPTKLGVKPTKTEAFPFGTTTLPHTKSTVRPSASSSSLYKDNLTTVPSYTDISFHSVTTQRDLGTLHVLSVHSRQPAFTIFQSLPSADPELSPSLMTASLIEFGRQDDLTSRTPPIVEFQQSQVQLQDIHSTPKKSEPKPNFTQYYLSFSGSANKTQFLSSVQATVDVSVSSEDTPSEKTPVADIPKQFVTNSTHSSSYTYLTASGLAYEDSFFAANLPIFATTSTPAKLRIPFSTVVKSLFFSSCSHQKYDLFSNGRYASESFISNPQKKEHLFTDENSSPLTAVLTEIFRWTTDLNLMDVMSAGDSATTGSASVHKLGLVPDASPVRQLYYNDNIPALTTYSTEEFSIFLFTSSVEFGLLSRTRSVTTELPSLPLSTSKELTGSFGFHNISPVEELLSSSRPISQKVFKTDEHTSEPFTTVPETNKLLFIKDKASTLTKMQVETLLWNKPSHLIYITTSGVVLRSQFLSLDSLSQGTSQTHSWYSYDTLLLPVPVQYTGTPKLHFSKNYFSSYASGIRISVASPDVSQLETSDLILTGLLETKAAFHISRKSISQKLKDSTVASLQAGLHTTSVFPGVQDTSFPSLHTGTSIFSLTPSEESSCCTETTQTPWLLTSQVIPTGQTNTSPRVVSAINWITATIGHKFSFSVPSDTFYDQEDGGTPLLTLGMYPADGSPMGPENWLHFNSQFQTMHGYPLAYDFQYSPQGFLLFATDSEGLKTSEMFTIELHRPTSIPCHNFTIRTKNSYHSFLRDRGRVYLFFEKLSKYLSSGSPGNMTLLHLSPGSTLITWYDHSFCTRNNRCARDEIQGVLVKLRLPGGNVHPNFVEAMLPEYNIYQTEDVAYGGTCSSNESLQTIVAFNNCYSWTRNIFFTLLISMCPAIMIILMIFWYCKYNTKIIGSQSRSFHGRPFLSYADLEMDVLKSQKAAVVEQEVPWPAELWLPVPTQSQQRFGRPNANLAASRLPPPPKYRLPPLY